MHSLGRILARQQDHVLDAWIDRLREAEGAGAPRAASHRLLRMELASFLAALTEYLSGEDLDPAGASFRAVEAQAAAISAARAGDGFTPTETATLIMSLKSAAGEVIRRESAASAADPGAWLDSLNTVVDRLALVSFAAYVETRERLIERQSRALLDLATPVLPIWRHIVLMPLVGIVDTQRARQIMEWLLDALAREEAHVAILDVTGVPVIDSRVALHLAKTVEAARLLGAQVVVTGISPEAAQTLVKLDVDLSRMVTRGTLRAGLAEAFRLLRTEHAARASEAAA
ncbi:STAS domain-containing protein [Methylobacterium sp. ID0610]|uniref:STAS domain-containing protein n=1 Tax=Methylobacterium carpenticola TaxID=3344827 RepID=UPI0036AC9DBD